MNYRLTAFVISSLILSIVSELQHPDAGMPERIIFFASTILLCLALGDQFKARDEARSAAERDRRSAPMP